MTAASAAGVAAGSVVSVAGLLASESSTVVVAAGLVSVGTFDGGTSVSVLSLAGVVSEESVVLPPAVVASVFALSSEAPLVAGTFDASSGFVGVVTVPSVGLVVASVFGLLSDFPASVLVVSVLVLSSPVAADGTSLVVFESAGFFVLSLIASAGLSAGFFVSLVSSGVLLASSSSIVSIASLLKCPCSYSYSNSLTIFAVVGRVHTM